MDPKPIFHRGTELTTAKTPVPFHSVPANGAGLRHGLRSKPARISRDGPDATSRTSSDRGIRPPGLGVWGGKNKQISQKSCGCRPSLKSNESTGTSKAGLLLREDQSCRRRQMLMWPIGAGRKDVSAGSLYTPSID